MTLSLGLLTTALIPAYFLILSKHNEMSVSLRTNIILCICSATLQTGFWLGLGDNANSILFIIPYLIIQSYTDAKTQYVYRFPSYVFGGIGIILCFVFHPNVSALTLWSVIAIIAFSFLLGASGCFGFGDSISMIVFIPYIVIHYSNAFFGIYLLMLIIGCISFSISHIKKKKGAFIPHLSIGYLIVTILLL